MKIMKISVSQMVNVTTILNCIWYLTFDLNGKVSNSPKPGYIWSAAVSKWRYLSWNAA